MKNFSENRILAKNALNFYSLEVIIKTFKKKKISIKFRQNKVPFHFDIKFRQNKVSFHFDIPIILPVIVVQNVQNLSFVHTN